MTSKLTRYMVTLPATEWERAHFELRIAEADRPFHMSLRRAQNLIVLNQMRGGAWGEEDVRSPSSPVMEIDTFFVDVLGEAVTIFIAGEVWCFTMSLFDGDVPAIVDAADLQWTKLIDSEAAGERRRATDGKIREVRLAGRELRLGNAAETPALAQLVVASFSPHSEYQRYLASRPIAQSGRALTIIDVDPLSLFETLLGALLFPSATVLKLSGSAEVDSLLSTIIDANDIQNVRIVSAREIGSVLTKGAGDILLQGDGLFKELGMAIGALPIARRQDLSIFTRSATPVPGNIVFPCANARVRVGKDWCLNHNGATDARGRRHGLDIAIAAYNAKDYLIECAESLLTKGRDDVRVIIVDDGSTDGCGELAARHFRNVPEVRVERKINGGCASARNYGRLLSNASHIAFVDADDFVTPGFFADLYDLALYSGHEITQGGFDFHDASRDDPYYPSYEEELFAPIARMNFGDNSVIRLPSMDIIKGQPTIWRKIYRRDFLDAKNIFFPENVRAYDDYIFQMLTLTAARDILMMPDHKYHYRQHPTQDIKQADERHFYMLIMFQMLLKRSIMEAWPNFQPYAESILDSINWSAGLLRADLVEGFLQACARFCVTVSKVYGTEIIDDIIGRVTHPDFKYFYRTEAQKLASIDPGAFWCHLTGELYHPDIIRMRQTMQRAI